MFAPIQSCADGFKISCAGYNSFHLSSSCIEWSQQGKLLQHFLIRKCHINEAHGWIAKALHASMGMLSFEKHTL